VIYIIGAAGDVTHPVKIGYSESDVARRLDTIQQANWVRLAILALLPGTRAEEYDLHRRFFPSHIRGEWFHRSADVNAFLIECGCPPIVARDVNPLREGVTGNRFQTLHYWASDNERAACCAYPPMVRKTRDLATFKAEPNRCASCAAALLKAKGTEPETKEIA
jgi:hypothetical protein